jgi:hypothetical protein
MWLVSRFVVRSIVRHSAARSSATCKYCTVYKLLVAQDGERREAHAGVTK